MELNELMARFAEGLVEVDKNTSHVSANSRTGEVYLPGVKTMAEPKFVQELTDWWQTEYPSDFNPAGNLQREVPYIGIPRAKCDITLSTDGSAKALPEWAIEVKHIALVGNNGKNNDFGVAKILSPYLKDRSLIHDIERLRDHGVAKRKAVIGYCFDYDFDTCNRALQLHPNHANYIENIREVCKKNDPSNGHYTAVPMIEFADEIFGSRNLVNPLQVTKFEGAWRHPCGGSGVVFGWELL